MHEKTLCLNILRASEDVFDCLLGKVRGVDESDLLYVAIFEYFWLKHFPNSRSVENYRQFDVLGNIGESLRSLHFLYLISLEYGYYAHRLIFPKNMEPIINKLNDGFDIADADVDILYINTQNKKFNISIYPQEAESLQNDGTLQMTVDILSKEFSLQQVLDEMSFHISSRRFFLKQIGADIKQSKSEKASIARNSLPKGVRNIRKSSDESRAIGLWCWDHHIAKYDETYKKYMDTDLNSNSSRPYACHAYFKPTNSISIKNLLFSLMHKKLLYNFHYKKSSELCGQNGKNCLIENKENLQAGIKNNQCIHFDSCIRKLDLLYHNALQCIAQAQVLSIGGK